MKTIERKEKSLLNKVLSKLKNHSDFQVNNKNIKL